MTDKPHNWTLADEGYIKVTLTDYNGQPYQVWQEPKRDYGKLWKSFAATFQQGIDYSNKIGGGSIGFATGRQETILLIENEGL